VRRDELAIEQRKSADTQAGNEMCERQLGGIGFPAKHTLAKKRPAKANPVKSADEPPLRPCFNGMRPTKPVQAEDGGLNLAVYPRRWAVCCRLGARLDNASKICVYAMKIAVRLQLFGKRSRHMETIKGQDATPFWLDPINILCRAIIRHRKHTDRIGFEQHIGIKRLAHVCRR
jgi:hypothetical protein